jgi:hypothetical protein
MVHFKAVQSRFNKREGTAMKASYRGVNKDVRVLSELTSMVPGQEGHVIKQITGNLEIHQPEQGI